MRIISAALRVLFFTSLPALCAYLGRSDILEIWQEGDYIGEAVDIALLKNVFLFTGVIITGVYLSLSKEIVKHKLYHISIQRTELLNNIKESFLLALENLIEDSQVNSLNVRIWKEKNNLWIRLNNWLKKRMGKTVEKKYGVHLLSGLSSADHMRDLVLRVDPRSAGAGRKMLRSEKHRIR